MPTKGRYLGPQGKKWKGVPEGFLEGNRVQNLAGSLGRGASVSIPKEEALWCLAKGQAHQKLEVRGVLQGERWDMSDHGKGGTSRVCFGWLEGWDVEAFKRGCLVWSEKGR